MNCDECMERVFALIEQEAIDPEGVRKILGRCPDCRAEFDNMKAALDMAAQLPVELPRAAVDAAILRTAAAGAPKRVPVRKRRLQAPAWAMAAIALLAVGVGVWTIPRERRVAVEGQGDATEAEVKEAQDLLIADDRFTDEEAQELLIAENTFADGERLEPPVARSTPARVRTKAAPSPERRAASKRSAAPQLASSEASAGAGAPPHLSADDVAAEVASKAVAEHDEAPDADTSAVCQRRLTELRRRQRDDANYVPNPEQALALGLCHQTLGNIEEARRWLQQATADPATKARAEEALRALAPE